ncbi:regulatory iron-sulfur-containing complex subunit RicT [uncultured Thermanaerothrix sp.]|uniref:PSP1 domain-containing protein n=1 Tax=uncultured Thermanaerothrix sp. TaxID=1195149 RepID=UPI0026129E48|nr:regulatory iron-sulfur-containing complex subunit RicT [uncultured Thermanaerothrix sp.]
MASGTDPLIVGVRFSKVGKVYHYNATHLGVVEVGDRVVVETTRGWQIGEVVQIVTTPGRPPEGEWKPISRLATPRDLLLRQLWQAKEQQAIYLCTQKVNELGLNGVKVIGAEYSLDGTHLAILYSSETEEKQDLKAFRQAVQKLFPTVQIEYRLLGPRDVAKYMGGMGACGLETRCCAKFLTEFNSISIRMAKEQDISLTPAEITGMCGRLRCCLIYEYEQYCEACRDLPKRNKRVLTPAGEGKVVDLNILMGKVKVEIPEVGVREFSKEEIKPANGGGSPANPSADKSKGKR